MFSTVKAALQRMTADHELRSEGLGAMLHFAFLQYASPLTDLSENYKECGVFYESVYEHSLPKRVTEAVSEPATDISGCSGAIGTGKISGLAGSSREEIKSC
ncbi:hypothetical protein ADUPG1_010371 [Aduncisulcus paluster]|uniref:Uncharacterized protein n=1 Tax=Aduncisulcus paluster TaxID=2918883 RepID=A0ABQ5JRI5_9EUKA|nr:hypothetical protein ADUPG1_010371 [Aduncisulcus paluster]